MIISLMRLNILPIIPIRPLIRPIRPIIIIRPLNRSIRQSIRRIRQKLDF